jgi:hypothetical protein
MPDRRTARATRSPDEREPGMPPLLQAWCQTVAIADATRLVAGARGLLPRRPPPLPVVGYPKVFVVGCPRSGTTWVDGILNRHPLVVGGRESHLYPTVRASIGREGPRSITAWARLLYGIERGARLGRIAGAHHYVDRATLVRLATAVLAEGGSDAEVSDHLIRAVLDAYFLAHGGTSEHVLVEKTPTHIFYAERILSTFPAARVVEVVRDGRDVCVSMEMRGARVPGWPTARRGQIDLWVRSVRAGLALRSNPKLRERVTLVRYEDLERDPIGTSERLFAAAGLDVTPQLVADAVAANDIRGLPTGPGEFRYKGESGTWAEHFSTEDVRLFRTMVGDLFADAGYAYD